jgi:hypothetical protein
MLTITTLQKTALEQLAHRRIYDYPHVFEHGIELGPEIPLVKGTSLAGQEARVMALLSAAYNRAVDPSVLRSFEAAERFIKRQEPATAMIVLIQSGIPSLPKTEPERTQALWRLFASDAFLADGVAPTELLKVWGYDPALVKTFNPDQPRVPAGSSGGGQWMSGDDGGSSHGNTQLAENTNTTSDNASTEGQIAVWDQVWQECHMKCVEESVGKKYGSDAPLIYRRCMHQCMPPGYGY